MNRPEENLGKENRGAAATEALQLVEELLTVVREHLDRASSEWLTVENAATELQVSRDTIERLIGSGLLKAAKIDTRQGKGVRNLYRIRRDWLSEYLLRNMVHRRPPDRNHRARRIEDDVDFIGD